jgi:hypothetical protein
MSAMRRIEFFYVVFVVDGYLATTTASTTTTLEPHAHAATRLFLLLRVRSRNRPTEPPRCPCHRAHFCKASRTEAAATD